MSNSDKGNNPHAGHRKRVKDSVVNNGFSHLQDHQLLELLLFYSIPREDTNALAHALLEEFGSLGELFKATPEQLKRVSGVGESTAILISSIGEASYRTSIVKQDKRVIYKTPEDYKNLAVSYLQNESVEKVFLFCFDSKGKLKKCVELSQGDEASSFVDVKKAVKAMMETDSKKAVIAHNHPVGGVIPSAADLDTTRAISVMFRKLGFLLVDHIIVNRFGEANSMYEDTDLSPLFY